MRYLAVAFIALTACDVTRGGGGAMDDGTPLVGQLFIESGVQGVSISSIDGWSCRGTLTPDQARDTVSSVFNVPIACTNGTSGIALVSVDRYTSDTDISFRLNNGRSGTVRMGRA